MTIGNGGGLGYEIMVRVFGVCDQKKDLGGSACVCAEPPPKD